MSAEGPLEVWAKPLADGSVAVGLFSRAGAHPVKVNFKDLRFSGPAHVRDLWLHKDLGILDGGYAAHVPQHGAVLVRVWK